MTLPSPPNPGPRSYQVEKRVVKVIPVDDMPWEPFSDKIPVLYEPLKKAIRGRHKAECNVLFKLRVGQV
jgi:hypothetical protein